MAVDHQTYVIKSGGRPQGAGSYGSPETVKSMIAATRPGKITTAAQAYDAMGNAIIEAQNALWGAAKVLADYWSGPAADAAQLALRRLHGTAGELVVRSNETAKTLQWYGGSILPMYKNIKWPEKNTDSPAATAVADQVMRNLNERIAQTWDGMPPQIEKNLPSLSSPIDNAPDQGASSGSPSGGAGAGIPTGRGGSQVPASHHPHLSLPNEGGQPPGSHGHSGGNPPPRATSPGLGPKGADLAGTTPVGGSPSGGGVPGLGGSPLGPATGAGGVGLGPSGAGVPAGSGFGAGVTPFGAGGVTGAGYVDMRPGGKQGRGGFSGGRGNGADMPLISGSGQGDERERERTTWLSEDPEIWTGGEDTFRGLIGDAPNRVAERERHDDDVMSMDELQELLDLVEDKAGGETGAAFGNQYTVHLANDALSQIVDARFDAMAERAADPLAESSDLDQPDLGALGIGLVDLDDLDDLGDRHS
jgi:hypothetical protein